jgi:putative transposase
LRCKQNRKFKVTTDSKHSLPIAPHLLDRQFAVTAPNKAWVTDITYISTDEGWLYLAGVKDLFNGELVGYAMSERMTDAGSAGLVPGRFKEATATWFDASFG